jgi:predicted MPP superfamily phosphohydrolase
MRHKHLHRGADHTDIIIKWIVRLIPVAIIILLIWAQEHYIVSKEYTYENSDLPKSFMGYKVTMISDLCNTSLDVVSKVKKADPDVIVLTGGYSDENGKSNKSAKIVDKLVKIAPVYYIYNMSDNGDELSNTKATNLMDSKVTLSTTVPDAKEFISEYYSSKIIDKAEDGDEESQAYIDYITEQLNASSSATIDLIGLGKYNYENGVYDAQSKFMELRGTDLTRMSLVLNSNIDNLEKVTIEKADIVMFGGTFGTNTISEDYTKGKYGLNGTELFVSGGIATPSDTHRFFNFPEIVTIKLTDNTVIYDNPLEKFLGYFITDVGTIFDNDGGFQEHRTIYENGTETVEKAE